MCGLLIPVDGKNLVNVIIDAAVLPLDLIPPGTAIPEGAGDRSTIGFLQEPLILLLVYALDAALIPPACDIGGLRAGLYDFIAFRDLGTGRAADNLRKRLEHARHELTHWTAGLSF